MKKLWQSILVFLLFFSIFFIPIIDTDFGWHLRCGQKIFQTGQTCQNNNFSSLLENYRWFSPAHGYQLLIFQLYDHFGFLGITFFYAFSAGLILALWLKILKGDLYLPLFLTLLATALSWSVFGAGLRSQIISFYYFILFLIIVKLSLKNLSWLWFTPLLILFWVNSHSGFFMGILLYFFVACQYFYLLLKKKIKTKQFFIVALIGVINILVSLLNPYNFSVYQEVWRHWQTPLNTLILEWVPPGASQFFLIISLTVIIIVFSFFSKPPLNFFNLLLLLSMAFFALKARRNLCFFYFSAVYVFMETKPAEILNRLCCHKEVKQLLLIFFTSLTLIFFIINLSKNLNFNQNNYYQQALSRLPYPAVDFFKKNLKPGNVFNAYEWGGYLIWQLPEFKVFVDGRMPSWDTNDEKKLPYLWRGKSPYTIYLEILQNRPDWQEILDNYRINYLLIGPGTFMDILLSPAPEKYHYKEVFRDETSVIYQKTDPS